MHDLANVIGQTTTTMWDNLPTESDSYYFNSTSEWVATDRLNAATGLNFSSWQEYYGPNAIHGDLFTTTVCNIIPPGTFNADYVLLSNVIIYPVISLTSRHLVILLLRDLMVELQLCQFSAQKIL